MDRKFKNAIQDAWPFEFEVFTVQGMLLTYLTY